MYKPIKLKNLTTIAMLLFLLNTAIDIIFFTVRVSRYASDMTHDALMRTCALAAYGKTTDLGSSKGRWSSQIRSPCIHASWAIFIFQSFSELVDYEQKQKIRIRMR